MSAERESPLTLRASNVIAPVSPVAQEINVKLPVAGSVQARPQAELPDITAALPWRGWDAGLIEAHQRRVPILALAESRWTNSAQRLGLVLRQDQELRELLADDLVPVLVDPVARPDLAASWRWAAIALTGDAGPPLLMLLTHEGLPFLSVGSMWPEGRASHPSLASLVRATLDTYARNSHALIDEARRLHDSATPTGAAPYPSPTALWQALVAETDDKYGGFREEPKHPHPQFLWLLLDLAETGEAPDAAELVRRTLRGMMRGGIHDQVGAGFHRCSRDERWIVPHFEKPLPLNAQLAAVYARAARRFDDDDCPTVAGDLDRFCMTGLKDGVDAISSDSPYYTWTSGEVYEHLDPEFVQAVALYYHLTPDDRRQVLYRAREPEAMDVYSYEAPDVLRRRIELGRRQLGRVRNRRPAPELVRLERPGWRATTICWLVAAEAENQAAMPALAAHLEPLLADCRLASTDESSETGEHLPWLEDEAARLAATVAVAQATGDEAWADRARRQADRLLDWFPHDDGWRDRPNVGADSPRSWAVTDDILPATVATVTEALLDLGQLLSDPRYRDAGRRAVAQHLPTAYPCGQRAAGFWRAWFRATPAATA